jgi:hypothetical protein
MSFIDLNALEIFVHTYLADKCMHLYSSPQYATRTL